MKEQRWQDYTNILLGAWLVLTPLFGIGAIGDVAAINSYLIGAAVVIFAYVAIVSPQIWEEYTNMALGLWLIAAPFALGFTNLVGPTYNQIIAGLLITGVALAAVLQKTPTAGHGHGHGHA